MGNGETRERDYFSAVTNWIARVNHSHPESGQRLLNTRKPLIRECNAGFAKKDAQSRDYNILRRKRH